MSIRLHYVWCLKPVRAGEGEMMRMKAKLSKEDSDV